jgi:spoIIIJ-associated protein
MSNAYEFQGKNVEQALEKASAELNIPVEKIKHEVVTYGSTGIFGLVGIKKAEIKVFVEDKVTSSTRDEPELPTTAENTETEESDGTAVPERALPKTPVIDEKMIDFGTKALQKIVDGVTTGATVEYVQKKEQLYFTVSGGESGVMIGKRGQTLEAMQYLLEKMVNKKSTNRVRVLVDVEGYLEKRKKNLQQLASRMAEKARRIKKPVTIGQMNAHDRRIVHIHLKDESGVRTQSIGDGYYRKLMIFPKKKQNGPRRRPAKG